LTLIQTADSFDAVADEYDAIRPGYPEELFDFIVEASQLDSESPIVEVGCGTGKATAAVPT